jgi:hypothetical protein
VTPERTSNAQIGFSNANLNVASTESNLQLSEPPATTPLQEPLQAPKPLPELMTGNPLDTVGATGRTEQPEPESPPQDLLPTAEPATNVAAIRDTAKPSTQEMNSVRIEASTEEIVIVPDPSPREEVDLLPDVPRVPPAPQQVDSSLARTESANIPRVGIAAPLVDPEIDNVSLEEAPINPPVASPAANVVSDPSLTVRLPVETKPVEPKIGRTLETTKLGREDQLLLVFDTSTEEWKRVDSTTPLEASDFIQSLPAFRADVEIGSDVVCTLVHASRVQLGPQANITLHDGKLILKNAKAGNSQGIQFQGEPFNIEMKEDGGIVAIEASRMHVPGADVTEMPHTLLKIHPIGGNATVQYMGNRYELSKDNYLLAFDSFAPKVVDDEARPEWATMSTISSADANAVRLWKRTLEDSDSIRQWLRERANKRYNERALAARCLAELDDYSAIVAALNDKEQHAFWDRHFEVLRNSLTRGTESVEKLRLELEKVHGAKASVMMEMIRGYSKGQLSGGANTKLVEYLSHPELDHRVLAYQNLRSITGFTQAYQAEKSERIRQRSIRRWNSKLKQNRIVYKETPEVVVLLEQFAKELTRQGC